MQIFITYLKSPRYIKTEHFKSSYFFKFFIQAFVTLLLISIIPSILKLIIEIPENKIDIPVFFLIIGMIILVPTIEEVLFRLWLKPLYINYLLLLAILVCVLVLSLLKKQFWFTGITSILIVALTFLLKKKNFKSIQRFVLKYFKYLYFLSALIFGLVHLFNIDHFSIVTLVVSPILILPQFVSGLFLGYIRMKFGIFYSILFHSLMNLFPALMVIFNLTY